MVDWFQLNSANWSNWMNLIQNRKKNAIILLKLTLKEYLMYLAQILDVSQNKF